MPRSRNAPHRNAALTYLFEKSLSLLGWLVSPAPSYKWFQFRRVHPAMRELDRLSPYLRTKIHRPYHAIGLDCAQRVDLLIGHYDFMLKSHFVSLLGKTAKRPLVLCRFYGKSGEAYRLEMSAASHRTSDGEWVVRLVSRDICIYAVSFLFTAERDQTAIKIGSLTGMLATGKEIGIRQVTRDLSGCRPKDLMVLLVRAIGGQAGCTKTVLIGNSNKLQHHEQRVCKKSSDYDRTWLEMHASACENGDFELPCISPSEVDAGYYAAARTPQLTTVSRQSMLVDGILQKALARLGKEKSSARYAFSGRRQASPTADAFGYRAFEIAE